MTTILRVRVEDIVFISTLAYIVTKPLTNTLLGVAVMTINQYQAEPLSNIPGGRAFCRRFYDANIWH